jgi:hypothetical protein
MKKLKFICLSTVALQLAVTVYFYELRTADKQLLFMAVSGFACIVSLLSLVAGFCLCFREKLRAFIPVLICIIGLPVSMLIGSHLGEFIQSGRFQKNLPRYNAVVQRIETGELTSTPQSPFIKLPNEYADLAWATTAKINNTNVVVEFMTESGFPVKHSGYLFISSNSIESDPDLLQRWPYYSKINSNWFRISD